MESLKQAFDELKNYWAKQGINGNGLSSKEIQFNESRLNIVLPKDFRMYFEIVNGMGDSYLTDTDDRGFSFYQLTNVVILEDFFEIKNGSDVVFSKERKLIVFADHLQGSWSYGVSVDSNNPDNYLIFMYIDFEKYRVIANSLAEFINMYFTDSSLLYEV